MARWEFITKIQRMDLGETISRVSNVDSFWLFDFSTVNKFMSESPSPLFVAIEKDDLSALKDHLSKGVDVNICVHGITPLMWASCRPNSCNMVETLLSNGANINATTKEGNTVLHYASFNSSVDVVKALISSGAHVKAKGKYLCTPLHLACLKKNPKVIKILIESGANVNAQANVTNMNAVVNKITPLHLAAGTCSKNVEILIQHGANVNNKDTIGVTPLHIASLNGHSDVVDLLLEAKCHVHAAGYKNASALHLAVQGNSLKIVESLLAKGVNVNAKAVKDAMPLHLASEYGYTNIVKVLVAAGAHVNAKQNEGYTPLQLAIQQKRYLVAEYLIEIGADVKTGDNFGWTPLHESCSNGCSVHIVKSLIAKGARVNVQSVSGMTPLFLAAKYNNLKVLRLLLENNADCNLPNMKKWTPLHCAAYCGYSNVVKCLIQKKAYVDMRTVGFNTPLHSAVHFGHKEIVELLLNSGSNVNTYNHDGKNPLLLAIFRGYNEMVSILLNHGADFYLKDPISGGNALHVAATLGHFEIVKILVSRGVDVNSKAYYDVTPLQMAAYKGKLDIVKYLISNGAKYDSESVTKRTVFDFARSGRHNYNVVVLLASTDFMFETIESDCTVLLKVNLEQGAYVNTKSIKYGAPIIYAADRGAIEAAKFLLLKGADVNIVNDSGFSALHYAAKSDNYDMVCLLLKHGAIYNIQCSHSRKIPFHLASKNSSTEFLLQIIHGLFQKIEKCNFDINDELRNFPNRINELRAINGARNSDNNTLISLIENVCAIREVDTVKIEQKAEILKLLYAIAKFK